MALAKCARCGGPYDKIRSLVCPSCQPKEDTDYEKIRDTLSKHPNLKAHELAEAAGVERACVLRMMDEGYLASESLLDPTKCGRCGAPAISRAKRLCQRCLIELNQDLMASISRLRANLAEKKDVLLFRRNLGRTRAHHVQDGVEDKRLPVYAKKYGTTDVSFNPVEWPHSLR